MSFDASLTRLTSKNAAGAYEVPSDVSREELVERLGRHEEVLVALREEYADAEAQIARMRDEGRVRAATYHQLVANRITLKSVLSRFADADL